MKKERLFYLDFIRAIAAVSIVLIHFNARYLFLPVPAPEKAVLTTTFGNLYLGNWGVSLFFIISGAALMYTYGESCELRTFYKKRFLSLYPMFWIAYSAVFLWDFYQNKRVPFDAPNRNIIFSILGFDGYLSQNIPTFYILGEWFLGAIILLYLIFPALRQGVIRFPVLTAVCAGIVYLLCIWTYRLPFEQSAFLPVRIPEFLLGMYFIRYVRKVNWKVCAVSAAVILLNTIVKPQWSASLQTTYIGAASFFVLVWLSEFVGWKWLKEACKVLSKYSYAIFLVHHVVIARMMATFDLEHITRLQSYLLFACCCIVIGIFTRLLYVVHGRVMAAVRR